MMNPEKDMSLVFKEMLEKGLIYSSDNWLKKAIEQKNPHLVVSLASSALLTYDPLDGKLLMISRNN